MKVVTKREYDKNDKMVYEFVSDESKVSSSESLEGTSTVYEYDNANNLIKTTISRGDETKVYVKTKRYTSLNVNVGKGNEALPLTLLETETCEGDVINRTYTDPEGKVRREITDGVCKDYGYDKDGKEVVTNITGENEADKENGKLTMTLYDENGNETYSIINPEYDGQKFKVTNDSVVTSKTYDNDGKLLSNTDALGNKTEFRYDTHDELSKVIAPEGVFRTYLQNQEAGNGIAKNVTVDAKGNKSEEFFNVNQEIVRTVDSGDGSVDPIKIENKFDERGNVIKTADSEGNYIVSEYSADGKYKGMDYYDKTGKIRSRTENSYDGKGRVISMKDYREVNTGEDTDGMIMSEGLVMHRYTHYGYDSAGRQVEFAEIDTGRMPAKMEIDKRMIKYDYDINDNPTKIYYGDELGNVESLEFKYDHLERVTEITANTKSGNGKLRDYEYDIKGRLISIKDYTDFAKGGLILSHKWKKCEFTYDALGRQTKLSYTDSENGDRIMESYTLTYDKNDNIVKEKIFNDYPDDNSSIVNNELDLDNPDEDQAGNEDSSENYEGAEMQESEEEGDDVNEAESVGEEEEDEKNGKQNEVRDYVYDGIGRLKSVTITDNISGKKSEREYSYDVAGNRIEEREEKEVTTYEYNSLNQVIKRVETSEENPEENIISNKTFTYDKAGNRVGAEDKVTGESTNMIYDPAGRLSKIEIRNKDEILLSQENRYNGDGIRIEKTEENPKAREHKHYYYQDGTLLCESIKNEVANTNQNNSKIDFAKFNILSVEGDVVATEAKEDSDTHKYHFYNKDVRSSTTNLLSENVMSELNHQYDEFGSTETYAPSGNDKIGNEICYTDGVYDDATDLYYLQSRYYRPQDGNFISQDSYRGEDDASDSWNMYAYCANDPINYADPDGYHRVDMPGVKYKWLSNHNMIKRIRNAKKKNKTSIRRLARIKKEHYRRNRFNYHPGYKQMKREQHAVGKYFIAKNWKKRNADDSKAHRFGKGKYNLKYTHYKKHYEAVYTKGKSIVTNVANIATYNFGHPGKEHRRLDVNPYVWLGNKKSDPIPFRKRLNAVSLKKDRTHRYSKKERKRMKRIAKYCGNF